MKRQLVSVICLVALALNGLPGCMLRNPGHRFGGDLAHLGQVADQTHYGDVHQAADGSLATMGSPPPRLLTDLTPADFWPMTPEEAVQLAVINSPVLRDLGGTVLRQPPTLRSVYDPALVETNPGRATNIPGAGTTLGVPAALSFFDAEFSTRAFFEKNDRAFNNRIVGLGTQIFQQDFINWQSELKKRSMTGGQYTFRKTWEYDANNSMDNVFGSAWGTLMDFEVRQPLFQGRGVDFNQIAGPDGVPGQMNGVRVARLNTDLAVTEYQIGLRDLVSNVENAYWDLYYAYRDLEAKIAARDEALQIWQELKVGGGGGPAGVAPPDVAAQIAQASEQYFRFQEQVQNALNGKLIQGTQVNNGSLGGSFRAVPGVLVAERRLRLAIGLPINDSRVIRPAHDPKMVRVVFNWDEVLNEALTRRSELQRQRTVIRRSELELLANRNFLLPRLDAFGRYRFRGLGKQLIDSRRTNPGLTDINGNPVDRLSFDNAYQDLTTGDFQEWQLGFEFALPIGFRRAHAAVRHSQLQLARERAVLNEQERQLVHDLSNSYAEVHRAFEVLQTAFNRRLQARQNVDALEVVRETGEPIDTNLRLDAQRRLADAESGFYAAFAEYMVAIKNVHFEKGSLLDYNEVYLVDDQSPRPGDAGAARRWLRGRPFDYVLSRPTKRQPQPAGAVAQGSPASGAGSAAGQTAATDANQQPAAEGWPMVRLPQVSLPEFDLPSFDNYSPPAGPSSPAQVRPPLAVRSAPKPQVANQPVPARLPKLPFRASEPNQAAAQQAAAPRTAAQQDAAQHAAAPRTPAQQTPAQQTAAQQPATPRAAAPRTASAGPSQPSYRFPLMSEPAATTASSQPAAGEQRPGDRQPAANPRSTPARTSGTQVAERPAAPRSTTGRPVATNPSAPSVVRPAQPPQLPAPTRISALGKQPPLVDLAERPAPPAGPRSRLEPAAALAITELPGLARPDRAEPRSGSPTIDEGATTFDRLAIFQNENSSPAAPVRTAVRPTINPTPQSGEPSPTTTTPGGRAAPNTSSTTVAASKAATPNTATPNTAAPNAATPNTSAAASLGAPTVRPAVKPAVSPLAGSPFSPPVRLPAQPLAPTPSGRPAQAPPQGQPVAGATAGPAAPGLRFHEPQQAVRFAGRNELPQPANNSGFSRPQDAPTATRTPAPIVRPEDLAPPRGGQRFFEMLFGAGEEAGQSATVPASAELPVGDRSDATPDTTATGPDWERDQRPTAPITPLGQGPERAPIGGGYTAPHASEGRTSRFQPTSPLDAGPASVVPRPAPIVASPGGLSAASEPLFRLPQVEAPAGSRPQPTVLPAAPLNLEPSPRR